MDWSKKWVSILGKEVCRLNVMSDQTLKLCTAILAQQFPHTHTTAYARFDPKIQNTKTYELGPWISYLKAQYNAEYKTHKTYEWTLDFIPKKHSTILEQGWNSHVFSNITYAYTCSGKREFQYQSGLYRQMMWINSWMMMVWLLSNGRGNCCFMVKVSKKAICIMKSPRSLSLYSSHRIRHNAQINGWLIWWLQIATSLLIQGSLSCGYVWLSVRRSHLREDIGVGNWGNDTNTG